MENKIKQLLAKAEESCSKHKAFTIRPKKHTSKKMRKMIKALEYESNSPEMKKKYDKAFQDMIVHGTGEIRISEDDFK